MTENNNSNSQFIKNFWTVTLAQQQEKMVDYFDKAAVIRWHNTNEQFTVSDFIRANCEYPGKWQGEVERIEEINNLIITATAVWIEDKTAAFHVVSFFRLNNGKIVELDEYWGDDGPAPQWRLDMKIGGRIN